MYLTPEKKTYYQRSLQESLLELDVRWQPDPGLPEILERINAFPQWQSLYSKYYQANSGDFSEESYLRIAFLPEAEKELGGKLMEIYRQLNGPDSPVELLLDPGSDNLNPGQYPEVRQAAVNDPDYFRVRHFFISLRSSNQELHRNFWEILMEKLGV